jgi:hypothetical protein
VNTGDEFVGMPNASPHPGQPHTLMLHASGVGAQIIASKGQIGNGCPLPANTWVTLPVSGCYVRTTATVDLSVIVIGY